MRRPVLTITAFLASLAPAWAFDFQTLDFRAVFNQESERQGSPLRAEVGHCDSQVPQSCSYSVGDLSVRVFGIAGVQAAGRIEVKSIPLNGTIELAEIEPIIAALCSPASDQVKRRSYLFALQTAYDQDEIAAPRVKVVLEGVRYLRRRLPSDEGEVFEVADKGQWKEELDSQGPSASPANSSGAKAPTMPTIVTPSASTKDIINGSSINDFKRVDPADLFVAPAKFQGKPVELAKTQCFYADVNEYRCVAVSDIGLVTIFGRFVDPDSARNLLEENCGTIKSVETPQCRRSIRFIASGYQEDDVNAFVKRMVFRADRIEIVVGRK